MLTFLVAAAILLQVALFAAPPDRYGDLAYLESLAPKRPVDGQYTWVSELYRWPDKTVPYMIDPNSNFTAEQLQLILDGFDEIMAKTCVKIVEKTNETIFVTVTNVNAGCFANMGYLGESTTMNLEPGCFYLGIAVPIHEFMHILGFHHEQIRYDRDLYIKVIWNNIQETTKFNFIKTSRLAMYPKYTYDFLSVMQYRLNSFTLTGSNTMELMPGVNPGFNSSLIGWSKLMSTTDIARINSAYKC
ncbi:zinc metalloproteinase nas-1-like [Neocloeon triangulifer]|uniref:zinc metalloproteinase nas-1-like n=1 Tax=Neocloeon triangulifer TaxID=2078957 RepID=UPI00286F6519|nr:zinc metalloproteinase nas-1-like [Neocloeon triangulifer]